MRLLGLEKTWGRMSAWAAKALSPVRSSTFVSALLEPYAGAWQRNLTTNPDSRESLIAFSAVFACVSLIAEDIAKLRPRIVEQSDDGVWEEVERNTPFAQVLRKPNAYQTRVQFFVAWLVSKLLYGNVYVLKERDLRGIVVRMHVLDPRLVTPLVAEDGSVYYQINQDKLSGVLVQVTVPASEIVHDRGLTLYHPLVGVSPIHAAGASATQGIRIQRNSLAFFENMSRPSGQLSSPGTISKVTADRLKEDFEKNYSGGNMGRLLVTGDGLKYEAMAIPAADSQLIEQLRWTIEDVARCFRVPLHKIASGQAPSFNNVAALNQDYYSQTLQSHIEAIEVLLDEGLNLLNVRDHAYGVEFDLDGLLRMDPLTRMDVTAKGVGAGVVTPNEGRLRENLPPKEGGDTPYMQQQNWALSALARRDAQPTPAPATPTAPGAAVEDPEDPQDVIDPADAADAAAESAAVAASLLMSRLVMRFSEATHGA